MTWKCNVCNKLNPDDLKYCVNCGSPKKIQNSRNNQQQIGSVSGNYKPDTTSKTIIINLDDFKKLGIKPRICAFCKTPHSPNDSNNTCHVCGKNISNIKGKLKSICFGLIRLETTQSNNPSLFIKFGTDKQSVGRSFFQSCDNLTEPELSSISGIHFKYWYEIDSKNNICKFFIEDGVDCGRGNGSTNGTLLNGNRITQKGPQQVRDGDIIIISYLNKIPLKVEIKKQN